MVNAAVPLAGQARAQLCLAMRRQEAVNLVRGWFGIL